MMTTNGCQKIGHNDVLLLHDTPSLVEVSIQGVQETFFL